MPTYQEYLDGTKQILDESQKETKPYTVQVNGLDIIVYPSVFSPKYFHDTEIFARHLPVIPGQALLEIGPGTGAVSIAAAYRGAERIVAIGINPQEVVNTQANIEAHHLEERISARQGDLYDALADDEKFDTIFWNVPFGLVPKKKKLSALEKAIYDPGYQSIARFFREASQYLRPCGGLVIGFSSTLGKLERLTRLAHKGGFRLLPLYEEESTEVHPVKFELYQGRPFYLN
jgi:release factor glutamine methyltransferase